MRQGIEMTDVGALMAQTEEDIARAQTLAAGDNTLATKEDWRAQIVKAGLGAKLANTIRGVTFPKGGTSLDPASWIYTNAPKLIDVYDRGATIRATDGRRYLAIPTKNVPLKGRGKRMTPLDVEVAFNQDLITRKGRNGNILAFVDVVAGRSGRGFRQATRGRLTQGRVSKLVLMFVLVRQVVVRKRYDVAAIAARAQDRYPGLLAARMAGIPDATAPIRRRR